MCPFVICQKSLVVSEELVSFALANYWTIHSTIYVDFIGVPLKYQSAYFDTLRELLVSQILLS